jgi:hypothetical protein
MELGRCAYPDGVELRRSRITSALAAFGVVLGTVMVFIGIRGDHSPENRFANVVFGLLLPLASVYLWRREAREPFQFRIDADGVTTRRAGELYRIGWRQIELVILDKEPDTGSETEKYQSRLLVVPGSDHPLWAQLREETSAGGRQGLVLLDLTDVRESLDTVAGLLHRYASSRFVDERH